MNKFMKRLLAGTMALVALATAGISAIATDGFGLLKPEQEAAAPQAPVENGGLEIDDVKGTSGMALSVRKMLFSAVDPGVAVAAEDAYELTATVLPADAADKTVTYSAAWENASSTWASGKNVTDYITLQQTSTGSLTATVSNKAAFGEPIIVTVTSNDNPDAKATATLHFRQKVNSVKLYSSTSGFFDTDLADNSMIKHVYASGTDTLKGSFAYNHTGEAKISFTLNKSDVYTRALDYEGYMAIKASSNFSDAVGGFSGGSVEFLETIEGSNNISTENLLSETWIKGYCPTAHMQNAFMSVVCSTYTNADKVAYSVIIYDREGGKPIAVFSLNLNDSAAKMRVESVTVDKVELEF